MVLQFEGGRGARHVAEREWIAINIQRRVVISQALR